MGPLEQGADGVTVEWAGQAGHPSSYGLLGGHRADATRLDLQAGGTYSESLAGAADEIRFGLLPEYEASIREGVAACPAAITLAGHGALGSSAFVFRRLAALLATLLCDGVPSHDQALWEAWDTTA
jgi:hypothetical protein